MLIIIDLFKPSGKWYMEFELEIPDDLKRFNLSEFISQSGHISHTLDIGWIFCVFPERQPTKEAEEFISFPELIKLEAVG